VAEYVVLLACPLGPIPRAARGLTAVLAWVGPAGAGEYMLYCSQAVLVHQRCHQGCHDLVAVATRLPSTANTTPHPHRRDRGGRSPAAASTQVATASADGSAWVFDAFTGAELVRLNHDDTVNTVVCCPGWQPGGHCQHGCVRTELRRAVVNTMTLGPLLHWRGRAHHGGGR
jgi:hypothetical protein